jgi:hypothetical protein
MGRRQGWRKPGFLFLKKPAQWVFLDYFEFFGFFGVFWVFLNIFAQKRVFRVFSVSRILLGASRL